MGEVGGGLMLVVVVVGIVLSILWVLLPFAVFSLKDSARQMVREIKRTNTLLEQAAYDRNKTPG